MEPEESPNPDSVASTIGAKSWPPSVICKAEPMSDERRETILFGAPICKGCDGLGHLYAPPGSPSMPDHPSGYADNWRRCAYCGGSGFVSSPEKSSFSAWAILTEEGVPGSAWISHAGALAESKGARVVPCRISLAPSKETA